VVNYKNKKINKKQNEWEQTIIVAQKLSFSDLPGVVSKSYLLSVI
jgi:hypothetical protein